MLTEWKSGTVGRLVGQFSCWLANCLIGFAAIHHAQDVVVLQKIGKSEIERELSGIVLNSFDDQDGPIM